MASTRFLLAPRLLGSGLCGRRLTLCRSVRGRRSLLWSVGCRGTVVSRYVLWSINGGDSVLVMSMLSLRADDTCPSLYTAGGGESLFFTIMLGSGRTKVTAGKVSRIHVRAVLGTHGSGIAIVKRESASLRVLVATRTDDSVVHANAGGGPVRG